MAKLYKEATNLLKFCMAGSDGLDLALGAGAAGFDFAVGVGSMYTWSVEGATGSRHLVAWAAALGSIFMGIGWRVILCGSFLASIPLPSSVNKAMISSWLSLGKTTSHIYEDSANPSDNSIKCSISSWCGCCSHYSSAIMSVKHHPSGFSSS